MSQEMNQSMEGDPIQKQAAEWVVKHDRGLTAQEQDAFFQWLAEDPRHGEAFAENNQSWGDFDLLSQWRPKHSEKPNPDLMETIRPIRSWKRWSLWAALAASVAVIAFIVIDETPESPDSNTSYSYEYSAVDYGYQLLEDGSEIDLNAGASLTVEYTEDQRLIHLVSGEAHFTVAKDPGRPFVVEAGGARLRAIGTAFNVRLGSGEVEVIVTEGHVRMEDSSTSAVSEAISNLHKPVSQDLYSGQRSTYSVHEEQVHVEVATVETKEIDMLLEWKPDVLDFSSTPLADAIVEFNERNDVQLVITDPELASQPIVASFRSNNIEGFVRLLQMTMAVEVDHRSEEEILLYRSKPDVH